MLTLVMAVMQNPAQSTRNMSAALDKQVQQGVDQAEARAQGAREQASQADARRRAQRNAGGKKPGQ